MSNWLITGGCGFLGRNLIKELLKQQPESAIRILDNLSVGKRADLRYTGATIASAKKNDGWKKGVVQLVKGDIMNAALALEATRGADVIVHLAANTGVGPSVENPRADCTTNVIGTLNYLEAARFNGIKRFVFASSGAPVGECTPPIHEELAPKPVSPYGASKLAGEGYCSAYFRTFGIETVALRFGNVYGPGSTHKSSMVAKFIRQALAGETLEIYGDGKQTRDFIYVLDLVDAIFKAAAKENIGGHIFQIATNKETTVSEASEMLIEALKAEGFSDIKTTFGEKRLGDVMRNFSDTTKAKTVLGWTCQYELSQGLRETVRWFLKAS